MTRFELQPARSQEPAASPHFHHWQAPNGEIVLLFYRRPGGYMFQFPNRADFTIALKDRSVSCTPSPNISQDEISALYFNQVLPLLGSYDGELVLHASAVVGHCGTVAFLGASGSGKSTLAAGSARAGHPFLTDDGLWLEKVGASYVAKPNRPGLRLWPDSASAILDGCEAPILNDCCEKRHLASGPTLPFQTCALPLRAIYVLGDELSDRIAIKYLKPTKAISELVRHAFILDIEDRPRHEAHFDRLVQLAVTVNCFTLDYPRQYEALPEVITTVLGHARLAVRDS